MPDRAISAAGVLVWRFTTEHFAARISEWYAATVLLLMGCGMALQHNLFVANPSFSGLSSLFGQGVWTLSLIGVSVVRLGALLINGAWKRSPYLRALTAGASALVWWTLLIGVLQSDIPTLAPALYLPMMALDAFNVYRSMKDASAAEKAARDVA